MYNQPITREKIMLKTFDEINMILSEMRDEGMVEPIDCDDCDPVDYAVVTGLFDELWPEPEDSVDF